MTLKQEKELRRLFILAFKNYKTLNEYQVAYIFRIISWGIDIDDWALLEVLESLKGEEDLYRTASQQEKKDKLLELYRQLPNEMFFSLKQYLHCIGYQSTKLYLKYANGHTKIKYAWELNDKELNTIILNILPFGLNQLKINLSRLNQTSCLNKQIKELEEELK